MERDGDNADFPFTATVDGFDVVLSRDQWLDLWSRMARQEIPAGHYYSHYEKGKRLLVSLGEIE